MKKALLFFTGKITIVTLLAYSLILSSATAQQVLQKSYAADKFNTDGTLITYAGSFTPQDAPRVTAQKMIDDALLEVDYKELNGGTTDDFIKILFATPLDLSSLTNRRMRIDFENDEDMIVWVAFSNVTFGPYVNNVTHTGVYMYNTDGDVNTLDIKFTASDVPSRGDFDNTNVTSAYIILNPTYNAPSYTTGDKIPAGTLKIHSIKIGGDPTSTATASSEDVLKSNVFYNAANKTIQYANLSENSSELMVYDITGKTVNHKITNSGSGEINAAGLSTGLYHVQIVENNTKKSFKILVQ